MKICSIDEIYTKAISLLKMTKMFELNKHARIVSNAIYSKMHYDMRLYLVVENEYMLRVYERGKIIIQYKTSDVDEALYWQLLQIIGEISYEEIKDKDYPNWSIKENERKSFEEKVFNDIGGKYYSWYKRGRNLYNFDNLEFSNMM